MRFEGKVAIITGGARGMGRATAERMGREGASVLVNYRANEGAASEVVGRLNALRPNSARAFRADVGDPTAVKAMVAGCVETFGGIDILVASAGHAAPSTILDITDEMWRQTMSVNLDGFFYCVREVVPHMLKRGGGAIVGVASMAAFTGGATSPAYTASKGAMVALVKKLARELAPRGIRVNAVAPSWTATDMQREAEAQSPRFTAEAIGKSVPIGRISQPEEIAAVIAFLCSTEASYVAGECVKITGGR